MLDAARRRVDARGSFGPEAGPAWAMSFGVCLTARAVAEVADAVVIGSKLVQLLEAQPRDNVARAAGQFVAEIRAALDSTTGA